MEMETTLDLDLLRGGRGGGGGGEGEGGRWGRGGGGREVVHFLLEGRFSCITSIIMR